MAHALPPMFCHVYKSRKRPGTYVYLAEEDGFSALPGVLLETLGSLEQVMALELSPQRRLARVEAASVIAALQARGYYLQLPPAEFEPA